MSWQNQVSSLNKSVLVIVIVIIIAAFLVIFTNDIHYVCQHFKSLKWHCRGIGIMLILIIMWPGSSPITVKTKGPSKFMGYTEIWLHEALHKKYGCVMKINI